MDILFRCFVAGPDPVRCNCANRVRWGTKQLYATMQVLAVIWSGGFFL